MTNNQHGQVPEALIDLIDAYAETRHRYGRIYNARTEAARNAVIEALSGVQALSAAPAEQQAPATGGYVQPVPDKCDRITWRGRYYHLPLTAQAAPKAAPGGSVNGWPVEAAIYKRRDEWVLELSGTINDCAFTCRHTQPGYLQPEDVAGLPSLYSEGTAPQQEAQEPVMIYHGRCTIDCGEHGHHDMEMLRMIPAGSKLYTAPQPAPDCHHRPPCDECAALAAQGGKDA